MTNRASWLDLDHAASAEGLGQTALLRDEERGRLSHGTCCSILPSTSLSTDTLTGDLSFFQVLLRTDIKCFGQLVGPQPCSVLIKYAI